MPFVSRRQQRFAFATRQPWAKRWAKETPDFAALPEKKDAGVEAGAQLHGPGGLLATSGMRKWGKRRPRVTTKPMTRSQAARVAALARWGKYTPRPGAPKRSGGRRASTQATQQRQSERETRRQAREQGRQAQRETKRTRVYERMGIPPEGRAALEALRRGEPPDPEAIQRGGFVDAGLVEQAADGTYRMTPAGRALTGAADVGDVGRAGDTISGARDRMSTRRARQAAQEERKRTAQSSGGAGGKPKQASDRRAAVLERRMARTRKRLADAFDRARGRRLPVSPILQTTKAQTAQERAMFAKMGGGGRGGSGGGKNTLWKKGPSGKRTPQAGTEGQARPADPGRPERGQTVGGQTKAYGADPTTSYGMQHELVDMAAIQASNTAGGGINPHYDPALQPRDRSRASSQAQIAQVAQHLNPDVMVTDFHRIDAGTPIIDQHGNVLSGNGRTLALQRAAEMHPDKYADYKAAIKAQAREAGIDPAMVDKMDNPVLVRRLAPGHDTAAFAREANSSGTLRMSPLEQAKVDADTISNAHMLKLRVQEGTGIDHALRAKENKPFIDDFLTTVPANERANLLTRDGDLNQMGLYRVKAAIYTRAFPGAAGERMAESMLESLDPDIKQVQNGISGGLPALSRATSLIRSGQRESNLDISDDLAKTIDVYARIKDNPALTANTPANKLIAKYLGQSSMFGRELNDEQERLLVHIDGISRSPTRVRSLLERYARIVENEAQVGQSSLFGEAAGLTRAQLWDALLAEESAVKSTLKAQRAMTGDLPLLPPVRKRTDYSDIKPGDLIMALFHDKIAPRDAMRESSEQPVTQERPPMQPEKSYTTKAQTDQERAMFANMGGGKGSGGGGGAWKKGPDGKRHPSAAQVGAMQSKLDADKAKFDKNTPTDVVARGRARSSLAQRQRELNDHKERAEHAHDRLDHQLRDKRNEINARLRRVKPDTQEQRDLVRYLKDIEDAISTTKRNRRELAAAGKSFAVFKDASGAYRWIARSTTAYRDRDREILPIATLDADSQRMTAAQQFGPLRWWHVGQPDPFNASTPWGPGLDLGDCDFSTQIGATRVESGTFRSPQIAPRIAENADSYELSPGFFHAYGAGGPPDGIYHQLRTFERSLVPTRYGRASNLFTGLTVKEHRMDPNEMERRFKAAIAELRLTPDQAEQLAAGLVATDKSAQQQGIAFKSEDTPTMNQTIYYGPGNEPGIIQDGLWIALKAAPPAMGAEDDPALGGDSGVDETAEGGPPMDGGEYIGDMTPAEFWAQLSQYLAPVLKMQDMVKAMGDHAAEMKGMIGGYATKEAGTAARIAVLEAEIARLKGDQPAVTMNADVEAALKSAGPQAPPDPNAPQIPNDPSRPWAALGAITNPQLYGVQGYNGAAGWQIAQQPPQNTGGN